jgi:hypothetical protein
LRSRVFEDLLEWSGAGVAGRAGWSVNKECVVNLNLFAVSAIAVAGLGIPAARAQLGPVLFDNGPFVTGPGAGFGGADVSVTESGTVISLGFNENNASPLRVADNFSLTGGGTHRLGTLDFFGVQRHSAPFTTDVQFGALYVAIYNDNPIFGAAPIAGDFTTNRLQSSTWTGAYRVSSSNLLAQDRPIMRLRADLSWAPALTDGTYWLVVSAVGDTALAASPNPQTIIVTPRPAGAEGYQLFNGNWISTTDYPFVIYGPCPADFNGSGSVTVQDIFDFLAAYFANDPSADVNDSGDVTVQDIFDYLSLYFSGCA